MSSDWLYQEATQLGRGIGAGEIDARELTEAYLNAIDAHGDSRRIYARVTADRARQEAEAAARRAKAGRRLSPLDGVPISWKDLVDSAGVATEAGSALIAGRTPAHDGIVLRNATAAGLVCLGKTHMSELAFSGLGYNPITETPPCVNDAEAVPGGSSSGAAASVAFGLAACGIGSDTGGSVRIPSAWNDLVGLKTTSGQLSLGGVVPLCARFDTIGPLARSVSDAALTFAAMKGVQPIDLAGVSLKGRRFLVLQNVALDDLEGAPGAAFNSAVERLADAGAEVVRGEVAALDRAMALTAVLYTVEAYATWRDVIEAAPEKMYAEILQRFRAGSQFSGTDYVSAWQELDALRLAWRDAVAGYDAVLTPTSPILPPKLKRLQQDHEYYVKKNLLALRNTRIGNVMGLCGVTLPTGVPSCGVQMLGLPHSDTQLMRIAAAAEKALA